MIHKSALLFSAASLLGAASAFPGPETCSQLPYPPSQSDVANFLQTTYDYIVVGGGTAGVAVATRLAENGTFNVGILEAGPHYITDDLVDIPALWGKSWGNSSYDWNLVMSPQIHSANRSISMPRGRMLGGSSGINGMAWNRASSIEYDAWDQFAPNASWSWDGLLPFFMKSENTSRADPDPFPGITPEEAAAAAAAFPNESGVDGPIDAAHNIFATDALRPYVESLNNMGIHTNADGQGGNNNGVYSTLSAIRRPDSTRSYSANRYYCQGVAGSNLHVLVGATVSKMQFLPTADAAGNFVAQGVEFLVGSQTYTVNVTKEVIVSAGPVKSPQVLELSGVGDPAVLSQFGIKNIVDLPGVGANLQEHVWAGVQWEVKPNVTTFDILRNNATFAAQALAEYRANGSGIYSSTDSALCFFWQGNVTGKARVTELLQLFDEAAAAAPPDSLRAMQYPIQRSWFAEGTLDSQEIIQLSYGAFNLEAGKSYVYVLGGTIHPMARGSVHITSADPLVQPNIDPNFLGTDYDLQLTLDTVKFIQSVGKVAPYSDLIVAQTDPSPSAQTDAELIDFIRNTSAAGGHFIGTNAMAPRQSQGVVDGFLKVYGLANVRVIDASIFPLPIGHTQATVYGIAEKITDSILRGF
ncbi:alcohol oxidase [Mycena vitilis]|nr:alcohol oxidase [Mycena vitilis]